MDRIPLPPILVDFRERQSGLLELLRSRKGYTVKEEWLPYGDILVTDILIERKTTSDLVRSLQDGRLFRQMSALNAFSKRRLLIVEGISFPFDIGVSVDSINGTLLKIEAGMQVPVIRTASIEETVSRIAALTYQEIRAAKSGIASRKGKKKNKETSPALKIMKAVPHLKNGTGLSILKHFKSLRTIFNSTEEELSQVEGVTKEDAEELFRIAVAEYATEC